MQCCSGHTEADIRQFVTQHLVDIAVGDDSPLNALFEEEFKGDTLSTRMKQIQQQKADEEARRLRDKLRYERKMEEERAKEREILRKRMAAELNKKQQNNEKDNLAKSDDKISGNSTPKEPIAIDKDINKSDTSNKAEISNQEQENTDKSESNPSSVNIEQTNNIDSSAVDEISDLKKNSKVAELKLDINSKEMTNDNEEKNVLDSDNSPAFPKSPKAYEGAVSDPSTNFSPNVLIQRQSKGNYSQ